ncbi:MAG TPA: agmatine deiminase family protein [Gemmataceae bacterium]|nr:agmatine deiminase family protein [Gemmataceae bacterium]
MPAEWWPHTRCWMAWPSRKDIWGSCLAQVKKDVAAVAQAIAAFESVSLIAPPASVAEAKQACGGHVEVIALPIDDCWTRDTGPTFLVNDKDGCAGISWGFNGWGEKYQQPNNYKDDALLARRLLGELKLLAFAGPLVIEGGNLCVDGEGTLLTSETALLNPNRNPYLQRGDVEEHLGAYLGVEKVIWLPGNPADTVTDGHVDGIACFCRPGVVIMDTIQDKNDPECKDLEACRQVLAAATDARGRKLKVLTLMRPREAPSDAEDFCSSYLNFYIADGGIVMPKFGDEKADEAARQVVAEAFPDRRVVQLPIDAIAEGGGEIHCITQQQPSGRKPA